MNYVFQFMLDSIFITGIISVFSHWHFLLKIRLVLTHCFTLFGWDVCQMYGYFTFLFFVCMILLYKTALFILYYARGQFMNCFSYFAVFQIFLWNYSVNSVFPLYAGGMYRYFIIFHVVLSRSILFYHFTLC